MKTINEINEKIIERAKRNLRTRDEHAKMAYEEAEAHHWKSAREQESYQDCYQSQFLEDCTLFAFINGLDWMDACRILHQKAEETK